MSPRILLATTVRWFATARLATAFARAGCAVEVVCPPGHPVAKTRAVSRIYRHHAFAPLRSLGAAIEAAEPDLVVPCDDLATAHLHHLYRRSARAWAASAAVRALVERSLGDPSSFPLTRSRAGLLGLAQKLGIRVPATAVASTEADVTDWLLKNGCPAVLKTDGSYGGRGVRIVHTVNEARRGWQELRSPPSPSRAIKRALVNRDMNYVLPCMTRTRPIVNLQRFVAGQDANATVACWKGKVLASIVVRALHTLDMYGPASLVEIIDRPDISTAVAKVTGQLGLSGLFGFDFILEEETREACLIEMNPRATQICHLALGVGQDLPAALRAVLSGEPVREAPRVTANDVIAFFPQEWLRDPASHFVRTAHHDVPWDEPDLVRACLAETIVSKAWTGISSRLNSVGALTKSGPPQRNGAGRTMDGQPAGGTA
jgi:hypothetical protein